MLGFIIFSYPLSLIAGLVLGALIRRPLVGILASVGVSAALAALLSLEFLGSISFGRLVLEMILPAAIVCVALGLIGAAVSLGAKAMLRNNRAATNDARPTRRD